MKHSFLIRSLVLVCCLAVAGSVLAGPPRGQLPKRVVPVAYDLTLTIVPSREGFSGTETITIDIRQPTDTIWLHGKGLDVSKATLELASGETLGLEWSRVTDTGLVKLGLPREVSPQTAKLHFAWTAAYSRQLDGLYKVVVDDRAYVFTQFEPIAARKVFPSFDDPDFKTPFEISLIVKPEHTAITTTLPVSRTRLDSGLVRIDYARTKPLPTYLIAFAVGPFDVVEAAPIPPNDVRERPIPLRGVAIAGQGEKLKYALEHTAEIVAALERYTGIPYPFQKLDLIAVPDFGAGAMENVGAITFRSALLLMGENAPLSQKRSFTSVMAHELAHYWFGNLVTVPWWNDIWLNEAFATWLGAKAVDAVRPEFRAQARLLNRILWVMSADSLVSARKIRQPVETSNDIYSAFDGITYTKGAGILRMFEQFVGRDDFQTAVHRYLKAHAYESGSYLDFIHAVDRVTDKEITAAFKSFLNQSGLPFLVVDKHCGPDGARLSLSQSRYLPLGSSGDAQRTWGLPVCLRYGNDDQSRERCLLMSKAHTTVSLDFCPTWVMPNADAAGYYRWALADGGYRALLTRENADLNLRERMSVADNIAAAVRAGRLAFDKAMPLLARFADSMEPLLVGAPMGMLQMALHDLAETRAERQRVRQVARRLAAGAFERLALLPESAPRVNQLKEDWISFKLFVARDPEMRAAAARKGMAWIAGRADARLNPALLGDILTVTVQDRGIEAFKALVDLLGESLSPRQRQSVINALGHANDPKAVAALRDLIFSDKLRSSEVSSLLFAQAGMEQTARANWEWAIAHFDKLLDVLPAAAAGYTPYLAESFCSRAAAREVEAFFDSRIESLRGGPRKLAQTLERIRICAAVKAHQRPHFLDWLNSQTGGQGDAQTTSRNGLR